MSSTRDFSGGAPDSDPSLYNVSVHVALSVLLLGFTHMAAADDCSEVDLDAPGEALSAELIALCRERLAGYKAPRSVDYETAMPRHETGKLYKRLLRDRYWQGQTRKI